MLDLFRTATALVAGLLFGFGLAVSGLLNPDRVRGFLDVTGNWDPSLVFVFAGAVAVAGFGVLLARTLGRPLQEDTFDDPPAGAIDSPLLTGSAIFGIGWALSGLGPGPGIASLGRDVSTIYVFALAMIAGVLIHNGQMTKGDD